MPISEYCPLDRAKLIFHQISPKRMRGRLCGIKSSIALNGMRDHLISFTESEKLTPEQKKVCEQAIQIIGQGATFRQALIDLDGQQCTQMMQNTIHGLSEGQEAIFPLRRQGVKRGHAYILSVKKEQDSSITVHMINTGEGGKQHVPFLRLNPRYRTHLPSLKWEHLFSLNPIMCNNLIQHARGVIRARSMKPIYQLLFAGFPTKAKRSFWHKKQRAGICAYKSLSVWLHHFIAPQRLPKNEQLYLRLKLHFLNRDKELLTSDETVQSLLNTQTLSGSCWKVENEETLIYVESLVDSKIERVSEKLQRLSKQSG